MINKYLDAFFECVTWMFKESDIKNVTEVKLDLSSDFEKTYQTLGLLIKNAVISEIILNSEMKYRLLVWENDNEIGGWLCQECKNVKTGNRYLDMLKQELGTIVESWGFENLREDLICNMNGVLVDPIQYGIGEIYDYFVETCEYENMHPEIELNDYIVISEEANGNLTLCNKANGEILLFAFDHCFDYVTVYNGCPEYTFYKIRNVENIVDYFEMIGSQWMNYLN